MQLRKRNNNKDKGTSLMNEKNKTVGSRTNTVRKEKRTNNAPFKTTANNVRATCNGVRSVRKSNSMSFVVDKDIDLMSFIIEKMHGISRNKAKSILTGQGVKINNQIVTRFDHALRKGDKVAISKHKRSQELKNRFVKVVYEDRWLFVVEKETGILSMGNSSNTFSVKTVLDEYLSRKKQKCTSHLVHRLDRDTSGLMIYAKTQEVQQIFEEDWHNLVTDRRYISVVSGEMETKSGSIESWLKDNKAFVTYSSPEDNGGKYALTHYKTVKTGKEYSLVELKLETGRKNQIRVHMKDIGHPVVGDVKYGREGSPIGRLALHAFRINFTHPMTKETLTFETPYPKSFTSLIK